METSPKKFCVPEIIDVDLDDASSHAPQYFKPGIILQESSKNVPSLSENKSSESTDIKNSFSSKVLEENQKTDNNENGKLLPNIHDIKKPTSTFENEFSNLKGSEFYDKAVESATSSTDNQSKTSRNFNALLVNPRQRGNPLLKNIRNVPWEFSEIEPDYVMGKTTCALFLSLRYHNLFPNYIHERLKALGKSYNLRVLLVQVDVVEPHAPLKDLSVIAILAECTLMVSWSAEEAGTYLETYKMYENKSADLIKEKQDSDNYSQLIDCLTTIRSVNKTDAMVLLSTFKTIKGIILASVEELAMCPGIGPLKAKRIYDALRKPLKNETQK